MPKRYGNCTNFGGCPVADSHKIIEVSEGNDFCCPLPPEGCGLPLHPIDGPRGNGSDGMFRKNRLVIILFVAVIVFALVFLMFNYFRNKALNSTIGTATKILSTVIAKTKDTINVGNSTTIQNGKVDSSKTSTLSPNSVASLDNYFDTLSDPNVTAQEEMAIRQKILDMFTSADAEVIQVNSAVNTSTGITIGNYLKSVAITHRKVSVVDKKMQDGKIFELYVSEK